MSRTNSDVLYLDDLQVGQRFVSGTHAIDADQIKAFAREFDPQPFHLDEAAAKGTFFGGLAASGWHVAAVTMKLLVTGGAPIAGGIVGAGGEFAWPNATRPGDVLAGDERGHGDHAVPFAPKPRDGDAQKRNAQPEGRSGAGADGQTRRSAPSGERYAMKGRAR